METRNLPCVLTDSELAFRRDKLAELVSDIGREEAAKKDSASLHSDRIKALESEMIHIAAEIRSKSEHRQVVVKREIDIADGIEEVVRLDTGEVVDMRALEPHERQAKLFEAKKPEADAG